MISYLCFKESRYFGRSAHFVAPNPPVCASSPRCWSAENFSSKHPSSRSLPAVLDDGQKPNIHHGRVSLLRNKGVMKFQLSRTVILNTPRTSNGWSLKIHPFAKESHDFVQTFLIAFHVDFQWCIEIIVELNITNCPTVNQLATMSIPRLGVGLTCCECGRTVIPAHYKL